MGKFFISASLAPSVCAVPDYNRYINRYIYQWSVHPPLCLFDWLDCGLMDRLRTDTDSNLKG